MTLKLSNVSVTQENETILKDINYEFKPGKIYVLIGRTAAGKTSLMRAIAGLIQFEQGEVLLNDQDLESVPVWERNISMVYQQFINYPNMNVLENVQFPLLRSGMPKDEAKTKALAMIEKVGLSNFLDRKPSELSGGQQQRVAIARALVRNARIVMLDEPLMNLDFKLREQLREEFKDLFRNTKDSITLYATTEPSEALLLGDEVLVMHEGQIIQHGEPAKLYENPESVTVAQILNDPPMSILNGKISGEKLIVGDLLQVKIPEHFKGRPDGSYLLGIRSTDIHLGKDGDISETGEITLVEVSGSETFVYVDAPAGAVVLQIEGIHEFDLGQKVSISFNLPNFFLFDSSGKLLKSPEGDS